MSGENVGISGGSSPVDALGALPLARGTRLRQYILQETLGAGGFGITYRARHEMLTSKSFAIKEYYPRGFCVRDGTSIRRLPGERDIFGHQYGGEVPKNYVGVEVTGWERIGNYALRFEFSDGHRTGLYSYDLLRELGAAAR